MRLKRSHMEHSLMKRLITWLYFRYVIVPIFKDGNVHIIHERHEIIHEEQEHIAHAFHERRMLKEHGIRTDH